MNHKLGSLLPRIPAKYSPLREDVTAAFRIVDRFASKAKSIRDDANLTFQGKRAAVQAAVNGPGFADSLRQIRTKVERQRAELASYRARLTDRKPVTDALAFQQQAEIRSWLRSLPQGERRKAVLNASDPMINEAVVNAPCELSGLDADFQDAIGETLSIGQHGTAVRDIVEQEAALDEALAAISVAEADLLREAE
ncbi:hypothetical protein [Methylocystis echinoides]|uniref:hypothetical protein n=1 Tax=Methylocystis echinoides TaxID=29468 RepID=UPI0034477BA7